MAGPPSRLVRGRAGAFRTRRAGRALTRSRANRRAARRPDHDVSLWFSRKPLISRRRSATRTKRAGRAPGRLRSRSGAALDAALEIVGGQTIIAPWIHGWDSRHRAEDPRG